MKATAVKPWWGILHCRRLNGFSISGSSYEMKKSLFKSLKNSKNGIWAYVTPSAEAFMLVVVYGKPPQESMGGKFATLRTPDILWPRCYRLVTTVKRPRGKHFTATVHAVVRDIFWTGNRLRSRCLGKLNGHYWRQITLWQTFFWAASRLCSLKGRLLIATEP
jgi:hypothetical protein